MTTQPDGCTCRDGGHALLCPVHALEAAELMQKLAEQRKNAEESR